MRVPRYERGSIIGLDAADAIITGVRLKRILCDIESDGIAILEPRRADDPAQAPSAVQVSRTHCKFDAGPLAVLVSDLGASKGTKLGSKDGKKIMAKVAKKFEKVAEKYNGNRSRNYEKFIFRHKWKKSIN